jgi:hypothetical protein
MTPELTRLLAILAAVFVAVVLVVYWWTQREPAVHEHDEAPLPLFGGIQPGERFTPPQSRPAVPEPRYDGVMPPVVPFRAPRTPPDAAPVIKTVIPERPLESPVPPRATRAKAPSAQRPAPAPVTPPAPVEPPPKAPPVIREFSTAAPAAPAVPATPAAAPATDSSVVNAAGVPGTMVEGHGLRFSVPAEGTLQFLPGRFEIGSGMDAGREIRFVHVPGPNGMEVTFGRSEGELYRHIQLRDKTVSRQHARMQLREGTWHLVNLSQTNPVAYNGTELGHEQEQALADGDRIDMGEVQFTFRSR